MCADKYAGDGSKHISSVCFYLSDKLPRKRESAVDASSSPNEASALPLRVVAAAPDWSRALLLAAEASANASSSASLSSLGRGVDYNSSSSSFGSGNGGGLRGDGASMWQFACANHASQVDPDSCFTLSELDEQLINQNSRQAARRQEQKRRQSGTPMVRDESRVPSTTAIGSDGNS